MIRLRERFDTSLRPHLAGGMLLAASGLLLHALDAAFTPPGYGFQDGLAYLWIPQLFVTLLAAIFAPPPALLAGALLAQAAFVVIFGGFSHFPGGQLAYLPAIMVSCIGTCVAAIRARRMAAGTVHALRDGLVATSAAWLIAWIGLAALLRLAARFG